MIKINDKILYMLCTNNNTLENMITIIKHVFPSLWGRAGFVPIKSFPFDALLRSAA